MVDKLTKEHRSWNMSRIRGKNTKPEYIVRSLLHRMGYRFTVNGPKNKKLPGKPDIVLPKYKTVIFVHGCFWHRHPGCSQTTSPSTRKEFWQKKFASNVERDKRNQKSLRDMGWKVIVIWECDVKLSPGDAVIKGLAKVGILPENELYEIPRSQLMKVAEKRFEKSWK
ncbi:MAG: very short patch repair endonuclease [Verrucomicrobiota bacterium]